MYLRILIVQVIRIDHPDKYRIGIIFCGSGSSLSLPLSLFLSLLAMDNFVEELNMVLNRKVTKPTPPMRISYYCARSGPGRASKSTGIRNATATGPIQMNVTCPIHIVSSK